MRGILIVEKEKGYTSHDVVARLRGICGMKKIGHTGTLDPDATGVLPVCLGKATKVCDLLTDTDKTYEAVLLLGVRTDTLDTTGTILKETDPSFVTEDAVREVIPRFTGLIRQVPPMYSARKVNGKKLYELARAGIEVAREARAVTIHAIDLVRIDLPRVRMRVRCSKGTYIRTLCDDIGTALGCGGCMESLVRTEAGGFSLADAHKLSEIEAMAEAGRLSEWLIPVDACFAQLPAAYALPDADKALLNGGKLPARLLVFPDGNHAAYPGGWDCGFSGGKDADLPGGKDADLSDGKDADLPGGKDAASQIRVYDSAGSFAAVYQYDPAGQVYKVRKMFV